MATNKPSVIPTKEQINESLSDQDRKRAYETEKELVTNEIYGSSNLIDTPYKHMDAVEKMKERTMNQLNQIKNGEEVLDASKSEPKTGMSYSKVSYDKNEEQIIARDEQIRKNIERTEKFQKITNEAQTRHIREQENKNKLKEEPVRMENNFNNENKYEQPKPKSSSDDYIFELSQPNYNAPFDVIPLPSKGKQYRNKKPSIKLAYMTTADENILTSPNLLQSGEFLEILINRKLMEPYLRYKDLLVGDRNAIMIWLRATGYGEMYPVTILDEDNIPFDTIINLNELKTKEGIVDADEDGLYSFTLPLMQVNLRFKLLTCGDIDDLDKISEKDREAGVIVDNSSLYRLKKMIVEVNGSTNRENIDDLVNSIRIPDGKALNKYIDDVESNIDLNINIQTPGGGSVATFLPLNFNFFWPDIKL